MKIILILFFTIAEMDFIGYNKMLGNTVHAVNDHTEQSWLSKSWKDQTDKILNIKWKTMHENEQRKQTMELMKLIKSIYLT